MVDKKKVGIGTLLASGVAGLIYSGLDARQDAHASGVTDGKSPSLGAKGTSTNEQNAPIYLQKAPPPNSLGPGKNGNASW